MKRGGTISIDTETTGLRILEDKILFWSMAIEDCRWCFPAQFLYAFEPLFARKDVTWCMANAKYDLHMLRNAGITIAGPVADIIVMDALVDDTRPHGLKDQSWLVYEAQWGDFKDLFLDPVVVSGRLGMDKTALQSFKQMSGGDKLLYVYNQAPGMVVDYASCDAYFTYLLYMDHQERLSNEELPVDISEDFRTLYDYFRYVEVPITQTLWRMERRGVWVDLDYVKKIDEPMRDGIAAAQRELCRIAGHDFNPKSPDQLRKILYSDEGFGLKPLNFTKGGKKVDAQAGTNEKALKILMERGKGNLASKFIHSLLEMKKLVKLHGTYVKGIHKHLGPDGRIHTRYNQAGARTSRLSSSDPNLQNIPRPDPKSDPYKIRGAFTAAAGYKLLDADYPQIEFRVAAVQANEEKMMEAVRNGWDIHNANTSNMYGIPYELVAAAKDKAKADLTPEDFDILNKRQRSKAIGLGALFGEGETKMALDLGIPREGARELKENFFSTYPNIFENIMFCHGFAHENGYTFTMLGRKRRLHRIGSPHATSGVIAQEQRQAYNSHIQGSAAEIMKLAMLRIDNDPEFESLGARLIMTVHDELVAECPPENVERAKAIIADRMAHPLQQAPFFMDYPVPIMPDVGEAHRWSDAH